MKALRVFAVAVMCAGFALPAAAAEVRVAVAANFTDAANDLAAAFKAATGNDAVLSFGSSGQLLGQIEQAAPFEVFLSADQKRPAKLLKEGLAVKGSAFTYAVGKLVLWSADARLVTGAETLKTGSFSKISIADSAAAPYGEAAIETMTALGLADTLKPKMVTGASIAQALQFVETGNAELGFVALSQVVALESGSRWLVPEELYTPIRQDAVLLKTGEGNEAATAFLAFLRSTEAETIIQRYGYEMGTD